MSTISKEKKASAIIALAIILVSASGVYQLSQIENDVYNTNWTWKKLGFYDGYDFATWTGLAIGDDVDNDGIDEFFAASRSNDVNRTLLIQELDGTHRLYDLGLQPAYIIDGTSLHDVDGDGKKEVIVIDSNHAGTNRARLSIFTFNATDMESSSTMYAIQTSGSNYGHGTAWFTIDGVESYYYAGCGAGEVTRVVHNYATQSKTEIDNFTNSGDSTIEFDIDGDGEDELLAVEGWCTNCARVYAYEINPTTGAYTSKTLIYDNDLTGSQAFSVELFKGDVDNDGIENLILIWMGTNSWYPNVIEAYEWNVSNYSEGNYTEGFLIDNSTINSELGGAPYGRRWAVGDVDNDGLNEFVLGTATCSVSDTTNGHLFVFDIGTNGSSVERTFVANFSHNVYLENYKYRILNPVIVNDGGVNKIALGVTVSDWYTDDQWSEVILLTYSPPPEYNYIYTIIEGTVLISVLGGAYYYLKGKRKKKK